MLDNTKSQLDKSSQIHVQSLLDREAFQSTQAL